MNVAKKYENKPQAVVHNLGQQLVVGRMLHRTPRHTMGV
jgi:hypothetical protein